jgi:hypothetical protein
MRQVADRRRSGQEEVGCGRVAGQADHHEDAAGTEHAGHLAQSRLGVHVVQRGNGGHQIGRFRPDRLGQEVASDVTDVRELRHGAGAGTGNAWFIPVNSGDLGHERAKSSGESSLAAAHVKRVLAIWANDSNDYTMVVMIMVPWLLQTSVM